MNLYLLLFVAVSASLPSSSSAPEASSSSARQWKYDVFLSFRGADTRKGVTFELYYGLRRRGIKTFKDDPDLEAGDPIFSTLVAAIEESRFAIVVLSPNYAFSTWCLEELRKICECMKDENRIFPIFYHVDPSDVRRLRKKSFEEAFTKHENSGQHTSEKVQQWRDALENMASISGWHAQNFRTDRELVDSIVDFVWSKVQSTRDFEAFEQIRPRPRTQGPRVFGGPASFCFCKNIFSMSPKAALVSIISLLNLLILKEPYLSVFLFFFIFFTLFWLQEIMVE